MSLDNSIQNKKQMYELYAAGRFGNRPLTLHYDQIRDPSRISRWTIRGMKKGSSYFRFDVPYGDLAVEIAAAEKQGITRFFIQESLRVDDILFQGEFAVDPCSPKPNPYLVYTKKQIILKYLHQHDPEISWGLAAKSLIRRYSDCSDWLLQLPYEFGKETEPTVVEFTVFRCPVGILSSNTIIWEVRNGY